MDAKKPLLGKSRVNKTREIYHGRSFSFVAEEITLPNGVRTEHAMVRHPGSTGVVPLGIDGKVVMTLQYRHAVGEYLLEIPAGTIEAGESPLACARRELEEETGFVAEEFIRIAAVHIIPAYSDERIDVYLARGLTPSTQNLDQDEILQVMHYPLEELMRMVREGAITDALTLLALHQAWMYLHGFSG
jgi:ADP-ribose pyrophosphatase